LGHAAQPLAIEGQQRGLRVGLHGRRARRAIEETHLAEEIAGTDAGQHLLDAPGDELGDDDGAAADDEHLLAGIALAADDLAALERALFHAPPQHHQLGLGDVLEQPHFAQEGERLGGAGHPTAPAGLGGHAADERRLEGLRALARRRLGEPGDGAEHGGALLGAQLVLGGNRLGGSLEIREEIRIDHRPADELGKTRRHDRPIIPEWVQPRKGLPASSTTAQATSVSAASDASPRTSSGALGPGAWMLMRTSVGRYVHAKRASGSPPAGTTTSASGISRPGPGIQRPTIGSPPARTPARNATGRGPTTRASTSAALTTLTSAPARTERGMKRNSTS